MKRVRAAVLYLWRLLLLSGDIEANPGPMTKEQEAKLDLVTNVVQRLEISNASVLDSINKLLQNHITLKDNLESLTKRVQELETKAEMSPPPQASVNVDENISKLQDKIDDLENRSRRSNVLFFGVTDTDESETWECSERLVTEFCSNRLGITVSSIARAHRLGGFSSAKKRPIIAKFYNDKDVELVLGQGLKLKNTPFSISRDYSEAVRDKRRKLLQFSKTIKKDGDRVRVAFNKLFVNNDLYIWDVDINAAVHVPRPTNASVLVPRPTTA